MEVSPLSLIIPDFYTGPKLQSAVDQAKAKSAAVWIPADYSGSDTYTNPNNVPVFDMRRSGSITFSTPGPVFNVINYGAVNDAQTNSNCTISTNKTQVCTGAGFLQARDVGKEISCGYTGAGAYGSYLAKTTITSVTNSTTVVTAGTSIANLSGVTCSWGTASATNDTAIATAVTAWLASIHSTSGSQLLGVSAGSPVLYFPAGGYLVCNLGITIPTNTNGWKILGDMVEASQLIFEPGCTQTQGVAPIDIAGNSSGELDYLTFNGMGGTQANIAASAIRSAGQLTVNQVKVVGFGVSTGFNAQGGIYARGLTVLNTNGVGFSCSTCSGDIDDGIFSNNGNFANLLITNVTGLNTGNGFRVGRGMLIDECGNNATGCTQVVNSHDVWFIGPALFGTSSGFCLNVDQTSFVHWTGGICGTFGADSNANGPRVAAGGVLQASDLRMVGTGTGKCLTNNGSFLDNGGNTCENMFQISSGTSTGTTAVLTLTNVGAAVNTNCSVGDALVVQGAGIAGYNGYFAAGATTGITATSATTLTYTTVGSNLGALGSGGIATCRNLQTFSGTLPRALLNNPIPNTCYVTITPIVNATTYTLCNFKTQSATNITRIMASSQNVTTCATAPIITISDGTATQTLTLTSAKQNWDSAVDTSTGVGTTIFKPNGTITVTYDAAAASACATPPTQLAISYNISPILSN